MSDLRSLDKKRFIKGLVISLLIVLFIESFRLILVSDGNGERFLAINMERLGNMDGSKSGRAIVLQPHTIETDWGDIRLRLFCSINRYEGEFGTAEGKMYKHNLTFFGQAITGDKELTVDVNDEPFLTISMYQYKREKFQYYGQDIIPATMSINYFNKLNGPNNKRIYEYQKGVYFYTTYTREDTSPITLNDGSVIYSEATYVIHAPEDEDWTIELDGDVNYERYIQFPNGKKSTVKRLL